MTNGSKDNGGEYTPKVRRTDDEYIFELRSFVFVAVRFGSEKKLRFQMWRAAVILPADEGNIFTQSFRDRLVAQARDGFNEQDKPDRIPHIVEDIGKMATILGHRAHDGKSMQEKLVEEQGGSITERLIQLAEENAVLFKTPARVPHAACQRSGHTEVLLIDSPDFRTWLRGEWRRTERERLEKIAREERDRGLELRGALADQDLTDEPLHVERPPVIPPAALATAVQEIMTTAILEGEEAEVYLRVAGHDGKVYVDLCNEDWEAVEITKEGWRVIQSAELPIRFGRSNAMKALPYPERGGSVDELRRIVNLPQEHAEEAWSLVGGWLAQALSPCAGDFPILVLLGGHGTAKSSLTEMFRSLVDPAEVQHEHERSYTEIRNVYIDLVGSWVLALDNVSSLPLWLSDTLCRVSSGAGLKTRTLFTDRDQQIFKGKRPIIMNGISEVVRNSDILDRSLLVDLPPIPGRCRQYREELMADFEARRPAILGALFDAIQAGLKKLPGVVLEEEHISRLADFDRWAVATEEALGMKPGTYLKARKLSREHASENALEAQPVWRVLYDLAHRHTREEPWKGTMKQLLAELNDHEEDGPLKRSRDWPKTPEKLRAIINAINPALLERDVHIRKDPEGSRRRGQPYNVYGTPGES